MTSVVKHPSSRQSYVEIRRQKRGFAVQIVTPGPKTLRTTLSGTSNAEAAHNAAADAARAKKLPINGGAS